MGKSRNLEDEFFTGKWWGGPKGKRPKEENLSGGFYYSLIFFENVFSCRGINYLRLVNHDFPFSILVLVFHFH